MPQLDLFAFMSELVWLLIFFGLFFYIILVRVLPNIYYVLKLRNRFHKLGFKPGEDDKLLSASALNFKLEEIGGYTIKLYDLTMCRFLESRDITTTKLYQVLFTDYIFSSFYFFKHLFLILDAIVADIFLTPVKPLQLTPKKKKTLVVLI